MALMRVLGQNCKGINIVSTMRAAMPDPTSTCSSIPKKDEKIYGDVSPSWVETRLEALGTQPK
ncbi:hypothetical protein PENANT_c023G11310 [Penicillium antarcticum]|uniref:Uncharacterized protein n=1 Tax=Penicillium antarcticum TaxID=416450 RepID=A0A1V6PZ82_9EURO|nr:uncharacterized protein N7508_006257 [Penicillium antarcticum]KAJ5301394.1 hypothetical protein N7508_006257 [Penicillium antarcticum]OQD82087.1 hypothetical protein PENANT_c023G11310 [Penicillium antarcticum]